MIAYHEANPDDAATILRDGIKRVSRGAKGDDETIIQADMLLDDHRPSRLKAQGVSRDNNIYAYYCDSGAIVDIRDGKKIPLSDFVGRSTQTVLQLTLDERHCFVSDLDTFDALKKAVADSAPSDLLESLASKYWGRITPLSSYEPGVFRRPEIMITTDIPPHAIAALN